MSDPKPVPCSQSQVIMTELVHPEHTNALDSVFGGVIMSWIDICAAIAAQRPSHSCNPILARRRSIPTGSQLRCKAAIVAIAGAGDKRRTIGGASVLRARAGRQDHRRQDRRPRA